MTWMTPEYPLNWTIPMSPIPSYGKPRKLNRVDFCASQSKPPEIQLKLKASQIDTSKIAEWISEIKREITDEPTLLAEREKKMEYRQRLEEAKGWIQKYLDGVELEWKYRKELEWKGIKDGDWLLWVVSNAQIREKPQPVVNVFYNNVYENDIGVGCNTIDGAKVISCGCDRIGIIKTTITTHPDGNAEFTVEEVQDD